MAQRPERLEDEPVLLDRIDVAKLLYVKPRSIKEYIKRGVLQPPRFPGGRKILFDHRAVLAALEPARRAGEWCAGSRTSSL
jgi:hypothetical protein